MPSDRKTHPTRMRMSRIAFFARFIQIASVSKVMEAPPRTRLGIHPASLQIVEQGHETKVHVKLLVTMKQGQARIVGDEVHFRFLIPSQHHDIFENSRGGLSSQTRQFEAVPMQMDRMDVIAGIAHTESIPLAVVQVKCG